MDNKLRPCRPKEHPRCSCWAPRPPINGFLLSKILMMRLFWTPFQVFKNQNEVLTFWNTPYMPKWSKIWIWIWIGSFLNIPKIIVTSYSYSYHCLDPPGKPILWWCPRYCSSAGCHSPHLKKTHLWLSARSILGQRRRNWISKGLKTNFQIRRKTHRGSFVPLLPLRQEQQHPDDEDQHDDDEWLFTWKKGRRVFPLIWWWKWWWWWWWWCWWWWWR